MAYISGQGREIPLDTRYEMWSSEVGWSHVKEIGTQARIGMFSDGIRAFVSSTPYGTDGRWMHIIGRMSEYIDFPIINLLEAMNEAEGLTGADRWGGGGTIGGAPRIAGSKLSPPEVATIVRSVLGRSESPRVG